MTTKETHHEPPTKSKVHTSLGFLKQYLEFSILLVRDLHEVAWDFDEELVIDVSHGIHQGAI